MDPSNSDTLSRNRKGKPLWQPDYFWERRKHGGSSYETWPFLVATSFERLLRIAIQMSCSFLIGTKGYPPLDPTFFFGICTSEAKLCQVHPELLWTHYCWDWLFFSTEALHDLPVRIPNHIPNVAQKRSLFGVRKKNHVLTIVGSIVPTDILVPTKTTDHLSNLGIVMGESTWPRQPTTFLPGAMR